MTTAAPDISFDDGRPEHHDNQWDNGDGDEGFRKLPYDKSAEVGVIGSVLLRPDLIGDIVEVVEAGDFYFPSHQLIFQAVLDLFAQGSEIDPVIVAGRLDQHNDLARVGGAPYLHTLIHTVPVAANARYYAEIVVEKSTLRKLVQAGTRVAQMGFDGTDGQAVEQLVDQAQQELYSITQNSSVEEYRPLSQLLGPAMQEITDLAEGKVKKGIPTGFIDLDELTNGLNAGQMVIIAARPGVGKSTLALDMMRSCSLRNGKTSVMFSLEMGANEIVTRLLAAETEVKLSDLRAGTLTSDDWVKMTDKLQQIQDAPLYIDDSPNLTMTHIRSKARRLKQTQGLDLVVIDYIQLMSSNKNVESRQQEVSEFSRQLKLLAKELEVPVIALSQLNRGPESRNDKKPQLSDLRESGSLEQDADMVFLLYRPDSQDVDSERAGEADIMVAKHRGGPIGNIAVAHQLHYSRFANLARG